MGCVTIWALLTMSSEIHPITRQGTCSAMWDSCTQAILCDSPSEGEKENLSAGSLSAISKRLPQMDWSGLCPSAGTRATLPHGLQSLETATGAKGSVVLKQGGQRGSQGVSRSGLDGLGDRGGQENQRRSQRWAP